MFRATIKSRENEDISILLAVDNHSFNYLCECGDASDLTIKECQDMQCIFISHTHIDHFVNFDFVLRHQLGIQRRVIICGPKGITNQVQARIQSYQWNLIADNSIIYEIREIIDGSTIRRTELKPPTWEQLRLDDIPGNTVYSNKKFDTHFTILDHKTDSIAYLFKEKNTLNIQLGDSGLKPGKWISELKNAYLAKDLGKVLMVGDKEYRAEELTYLLSLKEGDSVGIVMDHAAEAENHRKIKELFLNCNKVFIESFYKLADKEFAQANYHSYSIQSAKIMKECGVKEAIPVHFSRKYKSEEIAQLKEEFYQEIAK